MDIMRDERQVWIVPGAGALMTQNTGMSDCQGPNREGSRALTVKRMKKYEWREGGGGGAQIADELGQSLEFCYLYRCCTHWLPVQSKDGLARALLEKQLKKPWGSLPCSPELVTCPNPEPVQSIPHLFGIHLVALFHLCRGVARAARVVWCLWAAEFKGQRSGYFKWTKILFFVL